MNAPVRATSQFPISLGNAPCEGGQCIRVPVVFDGSGDDVELDLSGIQDRGHFSAVQTIFVNNLENTNPLTITCEGTLQKFEVPTGGFMYMPLLQMNPPKLILSTPGALTINFFFVNFFLPPCIWGPSLQGNGVAFDQVNPTDFSDTIAVGNTPQVAIPANIGRKGFAIANPDTATETLYVMLGVAGGPYPLLPGGTWITSSMDWMGDIYVKAATAAHAFTATEAT